MTLYELNSMVRDVVELGMPGSYWVEAELSEVRERSGHCYMELVQKDLTGNSTVARASARCWRSTWASVRPGFEQVTGEHFRAGLKVLLQVHAQFHENFGFSWIVTDIDPAYTLGDMARRRQEIIRILKEEGVFDLNKELCLSLFASRIAVVSSESAAGYGDFCNQLDTNAYGFAFSVRLFPAVMQGERTEGSIISALDAINSEADDFDCVVIIRGGGAVSDLSAFDSLAIAENVANFPLPVITGIGHERDESVLDMVANKRVKTPTAAAALLIENLKHTYDHIVQAQERISVSVSRRMDYERVWLERVSGRIPVLFSLVKTRQQARIDSLFARVGAAAGRIVAEERLRLDRLSMALAPAVRQKLSAENHRLELLGQRISAVDPAILLRRGYSITLHNGRAVYSTDQLSDGDVIETRLAEGNVRSVVRNKDN